MWMAADWAVAQVLQRPLVYDALMVLPSSVPGELQKQLL